MSNPYFDETRRRNWRGSAEDENEIKERFTQIWNWNGRLRGIIGAGTNRMNIYTVRKATQGLANYIIRAEMPTRGRGCL